jgi:hypothetical protein
MATNIPTSHNDSVTVKITFDQFNNHSKCLQCMLTFTATIQCNVYLEYQSAVPSSLLCMSPTQFDPNDSVALVSQPTTRPFC